MEIMTTPVHVFSNGDSFYVNKKDTQIQFAGKRRVLGTSIMQSGYSDYLTCVFNYDEKDDQGNCTMDEDNYELHLTRIARDVLNLDPAFSAGLSTASNMDNYALKTATYTMEDGFVLEVTAISTGGIDKNGARVGDPTPWVEYDGHYYQEQEADEVLNPSLGTINTFLHINARLSRSCMARALVTATEAKVAAVQELLCPSLVSDGIATGSGTDGILVICESDPLHKFTHAGKDCKLGEMIGQVVRAAVKETIGKQTGVTPASQHQVLKRLERFGLTEDYLYTAYTSTLGHTPKATWLRKAAPVLGDSNWVIKASMLAHALDQINWGLLSREEVQNFYGCEAPLSQFTTELVKAIEQQ